MNAYTSVLSDDIDILDTYKAMEKLVEKGLVRSIGLSNFNSEQIAHILNGCTIKPVMNQVEFSPFINQTKLIEFCKEREIAVAAYTPLGRPNPKEKTPNFIYDENVIAIGKKYKKTSAQVVLRYLVNSRPNILRQKLYNFIVSTDSMRIDSNTQISDKGAHSTKYRCFRL